MNTQITADTKLYIGIDMHKRSWKVHCSTELFSGKSFSMPPEPVPLKAYIDTHFSRYDVSTTYEVVDVVVIMLIVVLRVMAGIH